MKESRKGLFSLSPLAVFLVVYLVCSLCAGSFYRVPVSLAFLAAALYGLAIAGGPFMQRIRTLLKGMTDSGVLLMVSIFILAGAFASTARAIGSVEATVDAALCIMPSNMILAGLFLSSCFISMAIGTSVGTIAALVPIGAGVAQVLGVGESYMAAIIVGGAFFGDNLSFISDTTIAATRALGVKMRDKFAVNILVILPAVIVVTLIYLLQGRDMAHSPSSEIQWVKLIPYLLVIVLALLGRKVTLVLPVGIVANLALGLFVEHMSAAEFILSAWHGVEGMADTIAVAVLAGGLLALIKAGGGIDFIISRLSSRISGEKGAQASIAALVSLANVCTANNTVAIITTGGIAAEISSKFGIDPRKTASILDTFSCLIQGMLPYGAQLLMAASIAGVAPTSIIPHLYYPFIMGLCAILSIALGWPPLKKQHTDNQI